MLLQDLWTDRNGETVSREEFMIALQNVQALYLWAAPYGNVRFIEYVKTLMYLTDEEVYDKDQFSPK